mgnify:CR=1 FL=1
MNNYVALFLIIVCGLAYIKVSDMAIYNSVKSGELTLECAMHDGIRIINPELVTGYSDGVWEFENGLSKSCKRIKK